MRNYSAQASLFILFVFGSLWVTAQAPVANFSSDIVAGCAPIVVNFKDLSTNNSTAWSWDLGNGTISAARNPVTTYISAGVYEVRLTATNAGGTNTIVRSTYITVYDDPSAQFGSPDTLGCSPLRAKFTDSSRGVSGAIAKWEWLFGEGGSSNQRNPVYTYNVPGTFNVTLKVTNDKGCTNTQIKPQFVKTGGTVAADFSPTILQYCKLPVNVSFSNQSSGAGNVDYTWNFGDNTTATSSAPTHTYNAFGDFSVSLRAKNEFGCESTSTKTVSIAPIFTSFTQTDTLCQNMGGRFAVTSQPQPVIITWFMGDGTRYTTPTVNHTYTRAGTYIVKLVNDFGGCIDSVSKVVRVNAEPVVNFSTPAAVNCKAPFTTSFADQAPTALSYLWKFGDNDSATSKNPAHTYLKAGNYNVSLKVLDVLGCSKTLTKPAFIKIKAPVVNLTGFPTLGCTPYSFTPAYTIDAADTVVSYLWDFGDGSTADVAKPVHPYADTGTYNVKLTINTEGGCTATGEAVGGVRIGLPTSMDFSVDPPIACSGSEVRFTPSVVSGDYTYKWLFGDNTTSGSVNGRHEYSDTGSFTVKLQVIYNGCTSEFTKSNVVQVQGTAARFTITKDCVNRNKVTFTNTSIAGVTYTWQFGDGTSSTEENPQHTFPGPGNYAVRLTAVNGSCTDSLTKNILLGTEGISITSNVSTICRNTNVNFTFAHPDTASVASYNWSFDGVTFISATSPVYRRTFTTTGNYTLTAFVTDKSGCSDTMVKPNFIRVNGPLANFGTQQTSGCTASSFNFSDSSTTDGLNSIATWTWNFGDSIVLSYTAPPFMHTYKNAGRYDVKLVVKDQSGCADSVTKPGIITAFQGQANFTSVDSFSCQGKAVRFTDQSAGSIFSRSWSFGDGATSTLPNPSHTYTANGQYTIKLFITAAGGCTDSIIRTGFVNIDMPKAGFTASDTFARCPPLLVTFTSSSRYTNSQMWDLGDGGITYVDNPVNNFVVPGDYRVRQIVTSPGGCEDSAFQNITILGPYGVLDYTGSGCLPVAVKFKVKTMGAIGFTWDFGDGFTRVGTDSSIEHTYRSPGKFVPKILVRNAQTCEVPVNGFDTIVVEKLVPAFAAEKQTWCDSATVRFFDSTIAVSAISYKWYFGDNTFSTEKDPIHPYSRTGQYTVKLVVTSPLGCADSLSSPNYIKVVQSPLPFIVADSASCNTNIGFASTLAPDTSAITRYTWLFANGNTSAASVPPVQTFGPGTYTNQLTVTNSSGCVTTASRELIIHPLPNLKLTPDTTICLGDTIQLRTTGAQTYVWTNPANPLSCTTCSSPFTAPSTDTRYTVTGYSQFKCVSSANVLVQLLRPYALTAPEAYTVCNGKSVQLNAFGAPTYTWSPAVALSNALVANPVATPATSTVYTVTGYDSLGCFNQSLPVTVALLANPTVQLPPSITLAAGNTATLQPTVSSDVVTYRWSPSSGLDCTTCATPLVTAYNNIFYKLAVTNQVGCTTETGLDVLVSCNNSAAFIPNTFSPNGDGNNDVFYVRGKGLFVIKSVRILSRLGNMLFERQNITPNDPTTGWNGNYNGRPAETGVYVYVIEVACTNGQLFKYSGNITLLR